MVARCWQGSQRDVPGAGVDASMQPPHFQRDGRASLPGGKRCLKAEHGKPVRIRIFFLYLFNSRAEKSDKGTFCVKPADNFVMFGGFFSGFHGKNKN